MNNKQETALVNYIDTAWVEKVEITFDIEEEVIVTLKRSGDSYEILIKDGKTGIWITDESNYPITSISAPAPVINKDQIKRIISDRKNWKKYGIVEK